MAEKIDFNSAFGTWKNSTTQQQITIKAYNPGDSKLPMAEIFQMKDDSGTDINNDVIASTYDPYIMGNIMNIYPFEISILHRDRITLTHKLSGETKEYIRVK